MQNNLNISNYEAGILASAMAVALISTDASFTSMASVDDREFMLHFIIEATKLGNEDSMSITPEKMYRIDAMCAGVVDYGIREIDPSLIAYQDALQVANTIEHIFRTYNL